MAVFDFLTCRPSGILNFKKFEVLTAKPVRRPDMRQRAKFHVARSNHCGDMARISIFNKDLLYACLDHPRSVFGVFCNCAKFVGIGALISIICNF